MITCLPHPDDAIDTTEASAHTVEEHDHKTAMYSGVTEQNFQRELASLTDTIRAQTGWKGLSSFAYPSDDTQSRWVEPDADAAGTTAKADTDVRLSQADSKCNLLSLGTDEPKFLDTPLKDTAAHPCAGQPEDVQVRLESAVLQPGCSAAPTGSYARTELGSEQDVCTGAALTQQHKDYDQGDKAIRLLLPDTQSFGMVSAFTLRSGGVSKAPFDSLNLSYAVGDDPSAVDANRCRVKRALAHTYRVSLPRHALVNPHQVHGIDVLSICSPQDYDAYTSAVARGERPQADAVVCTLASVPVLLTFADCVPLILAVPGGFAVVHSGWRSTLHKIALHAVRALLGACPHATSADVHAWVGPHISETVYEVSESLMSDFMEVFGPQASMGERNLNLDACVVAALEEAHVPHDQIYLSKACTYSHPHLFFTHRRQGPTTGRIAACAWIIDDETNGYTS